MKCFCCGVEKDLTKEEIYPYDDGKIDNIDPGAPLLCIDCQPTVSGHNYRMLVLCFNCWHRLEGDDGPDMWTAQRFYEDLDPLVPFDMLPVLRYVSNELLVSVSQECKTHKDMLAFRWHPRSYNTVDWSKVPQRTQT